MRKKIVKSNQRCNNVVSKVSQFFTCIVINSYMLLKFVAVLAIKIKLNSKVFMLNYFGEASTFLGNVLQIWPGLDFFAIPGRYLIRSKSTVPSSHRFLSLSIFVKHLADQTSYQRVKFNNLIERIYGLIEVYINFNFTLHL